MKKVKVLLLSSLVVLFTACGGGGDGDSSSTPPSLLQVASGSSVDINLASSENLLVLGGCTNYSIYDLSANQSTSLNNPMASGQYRLSYSEKYITHDDSKGLYFYLSSGVTPSALSIRKTYSLPNRQVFIYKWTLASINSFVKQASRVNLDIYDSELRHIVFWENGKIVTLNSGTYYLVVTPFFCTDGVDSFTINEY